MAGIEAPGVAGHGDLARPFLRRIEPEGVRQIVGHRNLDLNMLAGVETLNGLRCVHLGRRGQDRRLHARLRQSFSEIQRPMGDVEAFGHRLGRLGAAADEGRHLDAVNLLDRFQMLHAKRALPRHYDFHAPDRPETSLVVRAG